MTQYTTLPIFRVVGYSQIVARSQAQLATQTLHQQWQEQTPDLPTFSRTLYAVYQYPDEQHTTITFGQLVGKDVNLVNGLHEVWIAPQYYAVYEPHSHDNWQDIWSQTHIQTDIEGSLKRRFLADLAIYPVNQVAKLYLGLDKEVEISEE